MDHYSGVTAFIDEPPTIEITAGIVRIHYRRDAVERVMSVRNFGRIVDRARRALERHAQGDDHVLVDD